MKKKKGFTLVELLAVIAILAILVIMALPAVLRMFEQARVDSFNNELNTIVRTAKQQYLLEGGEAKTWSNVEGSTSKLSLTGNSELKYLVTMDGNGKITKLQATNGSYQYNETNENGIDIVDKTDVEATSNLSESEKLVITLDDEGSGDEPVVSDELVFNDQNRPAYYNPSATATVAITAATNGTGSYTYSIVSQKTSSGTTVTSFSVSGNRIIVAANTGIGIYTLVLKATDTGSNKTKEATYRITVQYPALTLNGNGGSVTRSIVYTEYGTTAIFMSPTGAGTATIGATRSGYTLNGWYTSSSGGTKVLDASGNGTGTAVSGYINASKNWVMTGPMTLYAQWTSSGGTTATVTYNCNGGNGVAPSSATVNKGSNANLSSRTCNYKIAAGSGGHVYYMLGWNTSNTATTPLSSYTVNGNVTLYAVWAELFNYTGNYNVINDGSGNWRVEYKSDGTLTYSSPIEVDISVTGGGGAGASPNSYQYGTGAGGCGGATVYAMNKSLSASSYTVDIGAGGTATIGTKGGNGTATSLKNGSTTIILAAGGGGGGASTTNWYQQCTSASSGTGGTVMVGGSGAAGSSNNGSAYNGAKGNAGNYAFGSSVYSSTRYGSGGSSGSSRIVSSSAINGIKCNENTGVTIEAGRGGSTGDSSSCSWIAPTAGIANTGAGGGGGTNGYITDVNTSNVYRTGGSGGSGIVIIRNKR